MPACRPASLPHAADERMGADETRSASFMSSCDPANVCLTRRTCDRSAETAGNTRTTSAAAVDLCSLLQHTPHDVPPIEGVQGKDQDRGEPGGLEQEGHQAQRQQQ